MGVAYSANIRAESRKVELIEPRKNYESVEADTVKLVAGNRLYKVKLVNPNTTNHRGLRSWRVCKDAWRNLGSP